MKKDPNRPKMISKIRSSAFKPGNKANPKGRGASVPILKIFKEYTASVVGEMYTELMNFTEPQLKALVQSDDTPILRKNIAQTLLRDNRNNEQHYTELVLNRIIGPIPARSEVSGANGAPLNAAPPQVIIREYEVASQPGQDPTPK